MKTLFLAALCFFCLAAQELRAQQTVYASYKYVMGDNETKVDARRNCLNEAKRRCIERAGTYLESVTEVRNFQLKNDEITAYAAAVLKIEIISEEIKSEGESLTISMTVKAAVDTTNIDQQIQRLKNEKKLDSKLKAQQDKMQHLEQKLDSLKSQLSKIDSSKRVPQNNFLESNKENYRGYSIEAATSFTKMTVEQFAVAYRKQGYDAVVEHYTDERTGTNKYRVLIGAFATRTAAQQRAAQIAGILMKDYRVVGLK
jgi:hypothetical protein